MIKIDHTGDGMAMQAKGTPVQLASEAAVAVVLVAERIADDCEGYDLSSALQLITSTAQEIMDDMRKDMGGLPS